MSELDIPRSEQFDSTLALLADGYRFIGKTCAALGSKSFKTRLMLQEVICMEGREASAFFYQPGRFTRKGAMPMLTLKLLQDKGSVQTLDGTDHLARKEMFMSLMSPESIAGLCTAVRSDWLRQLEKWQQKDEIVLLTEVQGILARAVMSWAGLEFSEVEARLRTQEFNAMISGSGSVGPRNLWGQVLRSLSEAWAEGMIRKVRSGQKKPPEGSALARIALHKDRSGQLLSEETAAIELINILRPTVAVAWYVMFAAKALADYPELRQKLEAGAEDDRYLEAFVHEVRRFYPFFPAIGGRALKNLEWQGQTIKKGAWVLLDMYGTLHDPEIWDNPLAFQPERFLDWGGDPFTLIPQGGGDVLHDHRCAGEGITIELLKTAVRILTQEMQYEVPAQDLGIDFGRMPALVRSRIRLRQIQPIVSEPLAAAAAEPDFAAFDRPLASPEPEPGRPARERPAAEPGVSL